MNYITKIQNVFFTGVMLSLATQVVFAGQEIQPGIDRFLNGEYSEAYEFFDENKPRFNSSARFQYYYALSLFMTDNTRQALKVMERAIELGPGNADYHYALTRIFEVRGQEVNIISAARMIKRYKNTLRKTIELDPQHVDANIELTVLLLGWPSIMGGDKEEGRILLEKLAKIDQAAAFLAEARSLSEDKDEFERSEKLFLSALNAPETSVTFKARIGLARLYAINKHYDRIIPLLKNSQEQPVAVPGAWLYMSDNYKIPMYLAAACFHLDDKTSFKKYASAAEQASVLPRDKKALEKWFKFLDVEYDFSF